jgi:uncharacterized lipoprotein YmbA
MSERRRILFAAVLLLASCAAPPLTLYTLAAPDSPGGSGTAADARPLGKKPSVIAVARVTIPDELDTEDIVVRDGSTLRRSRQGRWASRLSLGITDFVTQRLAARYPQALVTSRPLAESPSDRVLINVGRLDVSTDGVATLDADWLVVPLDTSTPTRRDRAHVSATGPVATDQDVVRLVRLVLDKLAASVEIPGSG